MKITTFCLSIVVIFFFLLACDSGELKDLEDIQLEDEVGIERAEGVELLYSDSAVVRVAINAPTLLRYIARDTPKQVFPDGVDADFFNEHQQQTSKMVANYAEQFQKEQKVYLRDDVKIWNTRDELLETEELVWNKSEKTIHSTKRVRITTPTQIINGVGFKSNLDFTEWEMYKMTGTMEQKNMVETPF
ncbi:MAG: LPS export ABC transporter periplasmic protein LptC [Aureispira sp.]